MSDARQLIGKTISYTVDPEWGLLSAVMCAIADEDTSYKLADLVVYSRNWTDSGNLQTAICFFKQVHLAQRNPKMRPVDSEKMLYTLPELARDFGFQAYAQ